MEKLGWNSKTVDFRKSLDIFKARVAQLANEMFEVDGDGDLPVFVSVVDRTSFRKKKMGITTPVRKVSFETLNGLSMAIHTKTTNG